ncbi:DNA-directed RNA polymerase V subunit 1 [Cryptomeria japonica]|uniref:DNA-directed RNA polymerase V subunit 1 n=1 Tax=Cryptomeria japonica TaxID=3369 RepID=UPI0027DA3F04|nr:DNA-directed RNA polymerase V subunit 1 [Cryptomeria japonica]
MGVKISPPPAVPSPPAPPPAPPEEGGFLPEIHQAILTGIHFDLPTSRKVIKVSVSSIQHASQLSSDRLGLPVKSNKCETCGSDKLHDCDGHFGHLKLPTPVYHPLYVHEVKRILGKICLNCFQLKKQNGRKGKNRKSGDPIKDILEGCDSMLSFDDHKIEATSFSELKSVGGKFDWSKVGSDINSTANINFSGIAMKKEPEDVSVPLHSTVYIDRSMKKQKYGKVGKISKTSKGSVDCTNLASSTVKDVTSKRQKNGSETQNLKATKGKSFFMHNAAASGKQKTKQNDLINEEVSFAHSGLKTMSRNKKACPYCQVINESDADSYPDVSVDMVGKDDGIQRIELKISDKSTPPTDFWHFVDKYGYRSSDNYSRSLLPFEAMKILEQIPDKVLKKLGTNESVKQPGAFILECLPVPPNCVRIPDMWTKTTIMASDNATLVLRKILNVSEEIRGSRSGKVSFMSHEAEFKELQSLVTQYLRVKGAPKVPGSKEPLINLGRLTKSTDSFSNMWLDKIRSIFLKKSCGLSSRAIITGDAYTSINEIGIPAEIAKRVTIEECVNIYNKDRLQRIVDKGHCRTFVDKDGKHCSNEFVKTLKKIEIGEVINRGLQDGDIVLINRAPTIHKHSLLALRAYIHPGRTMIINPLICAPLGADFDGDCLHVFYPKSLESRAELSVLLTVDQQLFNSHCGEANFALTVDTALAANLLPCISLINKTTMYQLSMWTSASLPGPAIFKVHDGGPFWTVNQILQMAMPPDFNCIEKEFSINNSEIISSNVSQMKSQTFSELFNAIARHKGPKTAVKSMDMVECCLIEWLSQEGFSTGLDDLVVICDISCRNKFMKEMENKLNAISQLMKHMRGAYVNAIVSQVQKHLIEVQESITKVMSSTNSYVLMVESGNARSISKVVQQVGFLGLQLFPGRQAFPSEWRNRLSSHIPFTGSYSFDCDGKYDSPEVYGLIKSSFVNGLNPCEAFIHSLSCREGLLGQKMGLREPGTLFKNLMAFLRDLTIFYDGTVRNACGKFLVQFQYGSRSCLGTDHLPQQCNYENRLDALPPGEPVGILAGTAIANPAYKMLSGAAQNGISPLDILKETLMRTYSPLRPNVHPEIRASDRRVILHMKNCCSDERHCEQKAAIIQEHLKKVPLKDFAVCIFIEYQKNWEECLIKTPFIGHIQLDKRLLEEERLTLESLHNNLNARICKKMHCLNGLSNKIILHTCNSCNTAQKYGGKDYEMPCLHFALRNDSMPHKESIIDTLINVVYPNLLETSTKGDDRIANIHISWNNESLETWVPRPLYSRKKDKGEIMIEVVVEANVVKKRCDAWKIVFDACLPYISFLDLNKCVPYSIHEVYKLIGISCAYQLIIQRLSVALEMVGKNVFKEHLLLLSDCITYTGNIIGFNPAGYRDFYHFMDFPVPFTEGTLKVPIKCFGKAAQRGVRDTLSDAVACCSWGKRAPVGTGSNFDIIWHDMEEVKEPVELQHKEMDVCEFLEIVGVAPCTNVAPSSLCLGTDFDEPTLPCQEDSSVKILANVWDSKPRSSMDMDSWGENSRSQNQLEEKELQVEGWNNPSCEEVEKTGWNADSNIEHIKKNNGECLQAGVQSGWEHLETPDTDDGWNSRKETTMEDKTNLTENALELKEHNLEPYRGTYDGVTSLNKDSKTNEKILDSCSGWDGISSDQKLVGSEELHMDGWNSKMETELKVPGWDGECNDVKNSYMEDNFNPKQFTQVREHNTKDISGDKQARSDSLQFGYQGGDASAKFRPTGANTVPLGRKRQSSQTLSVPTVELHGGFHQKFQVQDSSNNGWNSDTLDLSTEIGSDGGWNSNQSVEVEAEPYFSQPSQEIPEQNKVLAEDTNNDGWNPVALDLNINAGWESDWSSKQSIAIETDTPFCQPSWGSSERKLDGNVPEATLKTTELSEGYGRGRGRGRGCRDRGGRGGRDRGSSGRGDRAWESDWNNNQSTTFEDLTNNFNAEDTTNNGWNSEIMDQNIQKGSSTEPADSQPSCWAGKEKIHVEKSTNDVRNPWTLESDIKTGLGSDWNSKQFMDSEPCLLKHSWQHPEHSMELKSEGHSRGMGGEDRGSTDRGVRGRYDRGRGRGARQFTSSTKYPNLLIARENEILQDVQPLMQSMKKILFQSSYQDGDKLTTEDEKEVTGKVLCHHPEKEAKIGSGIDYVMVDRHHDFTMSRCLFIVRKDGSKSDFSYKKCLKNLVQERFPDSAEDFAKKYF